MTNDAEWAANMAALEAAEPGSTIGAGAHLAPSEPTEDRKMWAILLEDPDDVHAVPDKETGDAAALVLNRQCERHGHQGPVRVIEWPHSRESWEFEAPQFHLAVVTDR